jgi:outer membrane autotransporter protein
MRVTPYAGLRYGNTSRSGYTEDASAAVTDPITYDTYSQVLTTGTAGVRLNGQLNDKVSYQFGGGIEYDLSSNANDFSGTSNIPDLTTFALANTAGAKAFRTNGSFGLGYAPDAQTRYTISAPVRGEAYTTQPSTNVMIGVSREF